VRGVAALLRSADGLGNILRFTEAQLQQLGRSWAKKLDGGSGGFRGAVAVAAEFNIDESAEIVAREGGEDFREGKVAFAERQMDVLAMFDVFDVNVADERSDAGIAAGERFGFGNEVMSDVEGETEGGI
jgi:hypothetical protein